jgi:hypothetical protein
MRTDNLRLALDTIAAKNGVRCHEVRWQADGCRVWFEKDNKKSTCLLDHRCYTNLNVLWDKVAQTIGLLLVDRSATN